MAKEEKENEELDENLDLVSALEDMDLDGNKRQPRVDEILNMGNPVFKHDVASKKLQLVLDELMKLVKKKKDEGIVEKAVIVSQWTSMLEIVKLHISKLGIKSTEINGQVPVKSRGAIVEDFNTNDRGPQVMLLSLGAGGVGLNLVGANHLFLLDCHWNPQLEAAGLRQDLSSRTDQGGVHPQVGLQLVFLDCLLLTPVHFVCFAKCIGHLMLV